MTARWACDAMLSLFTGETGHAGTVPVSWRHDAMLGACAVIGAIEKISRKYGDSLF